MHVLFLLITLRVDDDGTIVGIRDENMSSSLQTLGEMSHRLGAVIASVEKQKVSCVPELYAAEVHVKLLVTNNDPTIPSNSHGRRMVKIAFLGESEVGKSTLIGVLASGGLDNGQGSMRLSLLRHRHEVISGRTSSLSIEFLPFDGDSKQPIRHQFESMEPLPLTRQKQLLSTARVAQLMDLPGDARYQRITYGGLTSWAAPDWICLVLAASSQAAAARDLLTLILGLELPFFVVINKCDLSPTTALTLQTEVANLITECRRELFGQDIPPYAVSVMRVSCVTGEGVQNLTASIFRLHQRLNLRLINYLLAENGLLSMDSNGAWGKSRTLEGEGVTAPLPGQTHSPSALFCVEGSHQVPEVGHILLGTVVQGLISLEQRQTPVPALLGPIDDEGCLRSITIRSIHRMRLPVTRASTGQMTTLAVDGLKEETLVHRGMMLITFEEGVAADAMANHRLPMTRKLKANVVTGDTTVDVNSGEDPVHGVLYCMGGKWNARLVNLQTLHTREMRRRAIFELIGAFICPFPGTRIIFSGPNFRLQGVIVIE